jgi:hypothetical protein
VGVWWYKQILTIMLILTIMIRIMHCNKNEQTRVQ